MNKTFIFFLFSILYVNSLSAQVTISGTKNPKAEKLFHEGLQQFTLMNYAEARKILTKSIHLDTTYADALMLMAEIEFKEIHDEQALQLYSQVIRNRPDYPLAYFKAGQMEFVKKDYATCEQHLQRFLSFENTMFKEERISAKHTLENAQFAPNAMQHPVDFNPINLGSGVNSPENDYFPTITANGDRLFFTRLENGMNEEFYYSNRAGEGKWSLAQNLGEPVNSRENEGASCLSADGQYIFFTACNRRNGMGSCDIYISKMDGINWTTPVNLGFPINSSSWESQPSISFDGKTMYFTSNRPGGYGKSDIWKSTFSNGKWSAPVNLGPEINTDGDEQAPFIAKDDKTLYFNSDGHPGMGKMDLFIARKMSDGRWGKAQNLGFPINTHEDELSITLDASGGFAYYVAERPDGQGGLDIYGFNVPKHLRPEETGYMKGIVFDYKTLKKLGAHIELTDVQTEKIVVESWSNKTSGEFLVCLQGNHDYAMNVTLNGYLFYSDHFSLKNQSSTQPLIINIPLHPIQAGEKIVLKNIFFDTDKSALRNESKVELNKLKELLVSNPKIRIEISGHTDNQGDKKRNLTLSENRAKSVYDFLLSEKIDAKRMVFKGYAETQPVADNATQEGRQKNRRTEVKIIP